MRAFNALFIGLYYILRKYYRKEFGADRKRAEEYCFTYQRWDIIKNKKHLCIKKKGKMYMEQIIYHGSNVEVSKPRILQNGFYKDFGYGFYCTNMKRQAKRWAMTRRGKTVVNYYKYISDKNQKILSFPEMSDEWLDFVVACRRGIEHDYDIVEGPMADDQIWNFVEGFIAGRVSRAAFWELVKFNYPTHQIVFCTEKALKTLVFEGSDTL